MPKPAAHRLKRETYPYAVPIQTRFGDQDVAGHVNNVAMARLFEEGRFRFDRDHAIKARLPGKTPVVVSIYIDFVGETFHPDDVLVASGIGRIGERSWEIHQAAFQRGEPVAVCTVSCVCFENGRAAPVPAEWRGGMERFLIAEPALSQA